MVILGRTVVDNNATHSDTIFTVIGLFLYKICHENEEIKLNLDVVTLKE